MKLRIGESLWTPLCAQLLARQDVESAGLLFGEALETPGGLVVAIHKAFALPDSAYHIRRHDQLSIDPVAMNRLMRPARERGWSIFTIHTHPGATLPWFSPADDAGDARLMPSLARQIPGAPHGSLVLINDGSAVARAFDEKAVASQIPLRIVGRVLTTACVQESPVEPWFSRQALALGARGQSQLRRLRVGVVGLGGIGSLVSLQLAHLGVGELVLLDGDLVEASNLSRIAGATKEDIGRTHKVEVAKRYARSVGLVERIETYRDFIGPTHAPLLAGCDVIVSCVDRHTPRALLNRLAYHYLVPVIDLGVVFRVDETGSIAGDSGRVVVLAPGRPCLACWGHLDPHALRIEALSADERESESEAGYIQGTVEAQPSVVAFNALVAGAGVVELLRLVTAFAGTEFPPRRLAFTFAEGTVRRNNLAGNTRCSICGE
jgi:molybdopterin/thiamine biosynthesis adenylyltransferase